MSWWRRLAFWRKPWGWENLTTGEKRTFRTQAQLMKFLREEDP